MKELREKEKEIEKDLFDVIKIEARYMTVNDLYELWKQVKRGLKNNTFENYTYMYEMYAKDDIGRKRISDLKKTDIKRFYNRLYDDRGLRPGTIDSVHTVLHQVLDMAVDDDYIRNNPSDRVLKELMQAHGHEAEKRQALTVPQQELFLLRNIRRSLVFKNCCHDFPKSVLRMPVKEGGFPGLYRGETPQDQYFGIFPVKRRYRMHDCFFFQF